jgi:hypothetical protein
MAKKMKRFDNGGYTGDDPIVKYRMGMIDAQGNDLTKKPASKTYEDESMGEFTTNLTEPKAIEKTVVKTKVTPSSKSRDFDTTETEVSTPKKSTVKELKEVVGSTSFPKSFKEAGGNLTGRKSTVSMPSMRMSLPDPLANFDSKGKRLQSRDFDYKKGGKVSSASKRADGCAIKGKTKGKIC